MTETPAQVGYPGIMTTVVCTGPRSHELVNIARIIDRRGRPIVDTQGKRVPSDTEQPQHRWGTHGSVTIIGGELREIDPRTGHARDVTYTAIQGERPYEDMGVTHILRCPQCRGGARNVQLRDDNPGLARLLDAYITPVSINEARCVIEPIPPARQNLPLELRLIEGAVNRSATLS